MHATIVTESHFYDPGYILQFIKMYLESDIQLITLDSINYVIKENACSFRFYKQ